MEIRYNSITVTVLIGHLQFLSLILSFYLLTYLKELTGGGVCSAGIGRTGCFIAISIAIQQLIHERVVDILSIVANLRLDRS